MSPPPLTTVDTVVGWLLLRSSTHGFSAFLQPTHLGFFFKAEKNRRKKNKQKNAAVFHHYRKQHLSRDTPGFVCLLYLIPSQPALIFILNATPQINTHIIHLFGVLVNSGNDQAICTISNILSVTKATQSASLTRVHFFFTAIRCLVTFITVWFSCQAWAVVQLTGSTISELPQA